MAKSEKKVTVSINAYERCQYHREIEMTKAEYDEWKEKLEEDRDGGEQLFDTFIRGCVDPIDSEVESDDVYFDIVKPKKAAKS